jgi:hypothetical protein
VKVPPHIIHHKSIYILIIPLTFTAFTHLWNPIGFPHVGVDESVYLLRAMHVLAGLGPQVYTWPALANYDHPYFGQLFLAGIFRLIGYPGLFNPMQADDHSVGTLYIVPRVLMGLLAIVDTYLVYEIAQRRYNSVVAFIASLLFAVMPMTWLTRWTVLDSIQLPFFLSSILFAISYTKNSTRTTTKKISILLSGILFGLAIFTKVPVFTMIPLVGLLIYKNNDNRLKALAVWIIPVILIPLIWPIYAVSIGQFNLWLTGIHYQGYRGAHHIINSSLFRLGMSALGTDLLLTGLGIAGFAYAVLRRDYLILLWIIPYLLFLDVIDVIQTIYLIPLIPVLCIAAARLIKDLSDKISQTTIRRILPFTLISVIGIFGLVSTTMLITQNVNSAVFKSIAFVIYSLRTNNGASDGKISTVISYPTYSWILKYVYHFQDHFISYWETMPHNTQKAIFVSDAFVHVVVVSKNIPAAVQIKNLYHANTTNMVANFKDSYTHVPISIYQLGF